MLMCFVGKVLNLIVFVKLPHKFCVKVIRAGRMLKPTGLELEVQ